ncbi:hypothetical protein ACOSP7_005599 [Xanthoceras sorbifolium]
MNLRTATEMARCGDRRQPAARENLLQQRWRGAAAGEEDWKTMKLETGGDDWWAVARQGKVDWRSEKSRVNWLGKFSFRVSFRKKVFFFFFYMITKLGWKF